MLDWIYLSNLGGFTFIIIIILLVAHLRDLCIPGKKIIDTLPDTVIPNKKIKVLKKDIKHISEDIDSICMSFKELCEDIRY